MRTLTLPVVAHRLYGLGRAGGTVWSAEPEAIAGISLTARAVALPRKDRSQNPYAAATHLTDWFESEPEPPLERYISPGTRMTVAEIRDLIDGGGRAETTGPRCLNEIWEQAAIRFRLVSVVDHTILWTDASAMRASDVKKYPVRLNQLGVLNMYFFRSLIGADGVGYFSAFPDDPAKNKGFAAICDLQEWGDYGWDFFVGVAAHEVGHFLTLPHDADRENLMTLGSPSSTALRPIQTVMARACAERYLPAIDQLRALSTAFRQVFDEAESEPQLARAYLGERWRFEDDSKGRARREARADR